MTLDAYLREHGLTETAFADAIKVDQSTVHRLRSKGQVPSRSVMTEIFAQTGGTVTANDFFGLVNPDLPPVGLEQAA